MSNHSASGKPAPQEKFHFDNLYWENPQRYGSLLLYQIGDMGCEGGFVLEDHEQRCHEISYIVSGRGVYSTNGAKYDVAKGDVYLNLPGEIHGICADRIDPFRYFYLGFGLDEKASAEQSGLAGVFGGFCGLSVPHAPDRFDIGAPFVNIFKELMNRNEFSGVVIESCLRQILVLAFRDFHRAGATAYSPQGEMEHAKKLTYEIIHYIDANLLRIAELTQISEAFDYSYPYLSHVFSHEAGMSIQDYYNKKRFETAAERLRISEDSVTEVAEKLRFQSIHTFSRAFRQFFGMSPSEYRARNRADAGRDE